VASLPRKRYLRARAGPLQGVRVLDLTRLDPFRHSGGSDAHWRAYGRNRAAADPPYYDSAKRLLA
jgi:hypothetical protein